MRYKKASAQVVMFDNSDVITTSPKCQDQAQQEAYNWAQGIIDRCQWLFKDGSNPFNLE